MQDLESGDLVICRVNKQLATIALDLIRSGKKAAIRGKDDLAKSLGNLIKKVSRDEDGIAPFLSRLFEYRDYEVTKLMAADKEARAELLKDKVDTIMALSEDASSVSEVHQRLRSVFSDATDGIICSSIHRAKGLEANRVAIYKPELTPHVLAKDERALQQEYNLQYVSLTRARQSLWLVAGKANPPPHKVESSTNNQDSLDSFLKANDYEGIQARRDRRDR